jgi:predicted dehydrogenase
LKQSLAAAGGALAASMASDRALGAGDDIRLAIVGLRKKGKEHVKAFGNMPGVRIVTLCDCDTQWLDPQVKAFERRGERVKTCTDVRKILDDKDVDAVVVVVPDHWHALMTVWASQAGKDVYVEKPAAHGIREGRRMVEAARKYNRIVQVGSQNRSDVGLREAIPWIHEGHLGPIRRVLGFHFGRRESIGKVAGPQPIPDTCDYNLFQGPAPLVPLRRENLHYDWHWFWDTGTGEMGNIGAHQLDHARWAMGQDGPAPRALSLGGRFGYDDDGETPNTQIVYLDYRPVPLIYWISGRPRAQGESAVPDYRGLRASMRVECEGGFFAGGRGGGWAYDADGKKMKQFPGDGGAGHQANFIQAVRSRKTSDLRADIETGHTSATLCHLANISYRLGHRRPPAPIRKAVADLGTMTESVDRLLAHLEANEVDLDRNPITLGPVLNFDAKQERFVGDHAEYANMYLERVYRPPFVVPETV